MRYNILSLHMSCMQFGKPSMSHFADNTHFDTPNIARDQCRRNKKPRKVSNLLVLSCNIAWQGRSKQQQGCQAVLQSYNQQVKTLHSTALIPLQVQPPKKDGSQFLNFMALHLAYGWAKAYFQSSPINPERDCYDLGQSCDICHAEINPRICVRFCLCEKYSHYNCLIEKFALLTLDAKPQMRCQACSSPLKVEYENKTVFRPRLDLCLSIELIIALALIVYSIVVLVQNIISMQNTVAKPEDGIFVSTLAASLGLILGAIWLALILRRLLWKQQLRIKAIKPVPLDMQSKIQDFDSRLQATSTNTTSTQQIDFQDIKI